MRLVCRLLLALLVVVAVGGGYAFLRASLPALGGSRTLAGLGADVAVLLPLVTAGRSAYGVFPLVLARFRIVRA